MNFTFSSVIGLQTGAMMNDYSVWGSKVTHYKQSCENIDSFDV